MPDKAISELLWESLFGSEAPLLAFDALDDADRTAILGLAERERVTLSVVDRIATPGNGAPPWLQQILPEMLRRRAVLSRMRTALCRVFERAGLPGLQAKGFAAEQFYPPGIRRQFNDLEVIAPAGNRSSDLFPIMLEAGFECYRMLLRLSPEDGGLRGILTFRWRGAEGFRCRLELLIGEQPLSLNAARPCEPLGTRPGLYPASAEESLVFLAGEVTERRQVMLRDCLDLAAFQRSLALGRLLAVRETCKRSKVDAAIRTIESYQRAGARLIRPADADQRESLVAATWRALRQSWYPGVVQPPGVAGRARALRQWPGVFLRTLALEPRVGVALEQLGARADRAFDAEKLMERGIYVGFTLISQVPSPGFAWLRSPGTDIAVLASPFGTFVPLPLPFIPDARLQASLALHRHHHRK